MASGVSKISSSNTMRPKRRMTQNYVVIWVDENIKESSEDFQSKVAHLRDVVKEVNVCRTSAQCIEALKDLDDGKAFVILSEPLGHHVVPLIHDNASVHTIYIHHYIRSLHEGWTKEWSKIQGIFTSIQSVCESLKQVTRECDHNAIPMSFIAKRKTETLSLNQENLRQLPSVLMYSILFKEIILEIDDDNDESVKDLVKYCKENSFPQNGLDEFQNDYYQKAPIWWYKREIFLYSTLNRALRTLDIITIEKLAFFIRDLHLQLEDLHQQQSKEFTEKFIVYRGQALAPADFQQLSDIKGGFLSFNNFLSTNMQLEAAMGFVRRQLEKKNNLVVLFIMTIDPSKVSSFKTPYANIDSYNDISEDQEMLFSMNTVFKVADIKQAPNNSRLWEVQLTLIGDKDPQLAKLTQYRRKEAKYSSGWFRMAELMHKFGDLNQAQELYKRILEKPCSDRDRVLIYHQLAYLKGQQGAYKEALKYYEKSHNIYEKVLPPNHPSLATSCNNIALVYKNMGDYLKALEYYKKSMEIYEKAVPLNILDLASSYNNIAGIYKNMYDYPAALEYYEKSLNLRETVLSPNHPDMATSLNNIGVVYDKMGDSLKALEYAEKSLQIKETALSPNHPSLASSYNNIGLVYKNMGDYSKAREYYEKSLKIKEQALPMNHPSLANYYNNIAGVYYNMVDYSKALQYYEKSLEIYEKTLPPNHPSLATSYNNIAEIYNSTGHCLKTLEYYEKSLKIKEKALPMTQLDLTTSYNNIALVYENMADYSKALQCYEKSLTIGEKASSPDYPMLASCYNNIGLVYNNMGNYSKALDCYEKSLKIKEKVLSPNHPSLASSYNNIAGVFDNMGDYAKALDCYKKSLKIMEKSLPPTHSHWATSYNNIALVYNNMGEYLKALEYYKKSLMILENSLASNHPDLATSYNNIAGLYDSIGDYLKALEYSEKALKIREDVLPPNHPTLAISYHNVAGVYSNLGEYSKAYEYYEKALPILQRAFPMTHPHIQLVRNSIDYIKRRM